MTTAPAAIYCRGISKYFLADSAAVPALVSAVKDVSFSVPPGRTLTLLGPSGCGKTTILRLVAGFENLDAGEIGLGHEVVATPDRHLPPEQRQVGMVFQDYAIFPHLTVAENVGFGLHGRAGRLDRAAQVKSHLTFVGLDGLGERMPGELSGGQQQRVALARALATDPRALLLDEPFSNLDAAHRFQVRAEVKELLSQSGTTTIFVTHDQEEALYFGDAIAVMRAGQIEQLGAPEEIFLRPRTRFVAAFMGQTDFIAGQVNGRGIETPLGKIHLDTNLPSGTSLEIALRPDHVALSAGAPANSRIISRQFLGTSYLYRVALANGPIVHSLQPHQVNLLPGTPVRATIRSGTLPPVFYGDQALDIPL